MCYVKMTHNFKQNVFIKMTENTKCKAYTIVQTNNERNNSATMTYLLYCLTNKLMLYLVCSISSM